MTAAVYPFPSRLNPEQREAVPRELRQRRQWVRYRLTEPVSGGKRSKKPWHPTENRPASVTEPATWGEFGDALENAGRDGTHGIGFVFTAEDPFVGIDLDGCFDPHTWKLSDYAQQLVDSFATYTEVSPSGTGLHLIGRGVLPDSGKNNSRVEVYDRKRYFCVTGGCIQDPILPVRDIQPELDRLLAQEFSGTAGAGDDAAAGATSPPRDQDGWGPPPGTPRHDWLCSKAARLASHGFPVEGTLGALRGWRDQLPGDRAIPDSELEGIAASAVTKFGKPAAADPATAEPYPTWTLADAREAEPVTREWVMPGLDARRRALLVAPSETGKTWLLLELAVKAACGGKVFSEFQVPRPYKVLVVAEEDYREDLLVRLKNLVSGSVVDEALVQQNLRIVSGEGFWFGDPAAVARLTRTVTEFQPDILAFDTLSQVSDIKKLADAEEVVRFYRERVDPLRNICGSGVWFTYHANKLSYSREPQTDESGMIHGSDQFRRVNECVLFMRPAPEAAGTPEGGFSFVLSTNKRRVGRRQGSGKYLVCLRPEPTAIALGKADDETPVCLLYQGQVDAQEAARLVRRPTSADSVAEKFRAATGPVSKEDLAKQCQVSESLAEKVIAAETKAGRAEKVREGKKGQPALFTPKVGA